ncbi:DUF4058 family protein [Microcoleus sp. Pol14C2]|uniref:DUF4058 family protein n=1 Tax=unclassified Microcoleus TaxID=2642155 RepID=UPI002FD686ED
MIAFLIIELEPETANHDICHTPSDYRILVSRANLGLEAELYPFNVRESIPQFLFSLQSGTQQPVANLSNVLKQVYEEATVDFAIDYSVQPVPALDDRDF